MKLILAGARSPRYVKGGVDTCVRCRTTLRDWRLRDARWNYIAMPISVFGFGFRSCGEIASLHAKRKQNYREQVLHEHRTTFVSRTEKVRLIPSMNIVAAVLLHIKCHPARMAPTDQLYPTSSVLLRSTEFVSHPCPPTILLWWHRHVSAQALIIPAQWFQTHSSAGVTYPTPKGRGPTKAGEEKKRGMTIFW